MTYQERRQEERQRRPWGIDASATVAPPPRCLKGRDAWGPGTIHATMGTGRVNRPSPRGRTDADQKRVPCTRAGGRDIADRADAVDLPQRLPSAVARQSARRGGSDSVLRRTDMSAG